MFKYLRMAWEEAKQQKLMDKRKENLLKKDMDFQFLEEIVQKVNENPQLQVRVTLKDGTILDVNTKPKVKNIIHSEVYENDLWEVK